jgi:Holliday junction resolvase RusA-like endonuclease
MSQNIVELKFAGNIPAKKNSRINRGDGMSFPSRDFEKWQKLLCKTSACKQSVEFVDPLSMELLFTLARSRADLDNRLTSILDMLVKCHVLPDDNWENVPAIALQAEYRKNRPGAFMRMTELPADYLGPEYAERASAPKESPGNASAIRMLQLQYLV